METFKLDCICFAINRAALSTPPPAANGTTNLIVPSGNLVCADAKVAIGQKAVVSGREVQSLRGLIQDHKVVTGALHFGELNSHSCNYRVYSVGSGAREARWRVLAAKCSHAPTLANS